MHLIYVDDSGDNKVRIFSALAIPADTWHEAEAQIRHYRSSLYDSDGIFLHREFHAWEFTSGRGQIADRIINRTRRSEIFKATLLLTANLLGAQLFNVVFPANEDERAFTHLIEGIDRTLQAWDSHAILICDEGKNATYTRLCRQINVYDPAAAKDRTSGAGVGAISPSRIIEDPFFRDSRRSYIIQLSDFCAYALLRREQPLPSKSRYGLDQAFILLSPILVRMTNPQDEDGIIRP